MTLIDLKYFFLPSNSVTFLLERSLAMEILEFWMLLVYLIFILKNKYCSWKRWKTLSCHSTLDVRSKQQRWNYIWIVVLFALGMGALHAIGLVKIIFLGILSSFSIEKKKKRKQRLKSQFKTVFQSNPRIIADNVRPIGGMLNTCLLVRIHSIEEY